jgi:alpha,alpha-trehalase
MRLFRLLVFALAAISIARAQETAPDGTQNSAPNPEATLSYIHSAWETLTRSMTDCHSLVDIKVTTNPILYLPAEVPAPPPVTELEQKCHVMIAKLPRHIEKLGDVHTEELSHPGLLYLPFHYVVPGGTFKKIYNRNNVWLG